jgi:hypothetical protein
VHIRYSLARALALASCKALRDRARTRSSHRPTLWQGYTSLSATALRLPAASRGTLRCAKHDLDALSDCLGDALSRNARHRFDTEAGSKYDPDSETYKCKKSKRSPHIESQQEQRLPRKHTRERVQKVDPVVCLPIDLSTPAYTRGTKAQSAIL